MNIRSVNYEKLFKEAVEEVLDTKVENFAVQIAIQDVLEKLKLQTINDLFNPKWDMLSSRIIKMIMKSELEIAFECYYQKSFDIIFEENICYAQYEIQRLIERIIYLYEMENEEEIVAIIDWLYG